MRGTGRYLPSGMFPALKAASPVAFFWRAVSKFLSIVSGSEDIVVEEEKDGDERNKIGVDSYVTTVLTYSCPRGRSIFPDTGNDLRLPHVLPYCGFITHHSSMLYLPSDLNPVVPPTSKKIRVPLG